MTVGSANEGMDALETRINETLQAHSAEADATQAQWQRDNQEFIKNEISQHVRHYAGQEKRIRALEGRKGLTNARDDKRMTLQTKGDANL